MYKTLRGLVLREVRRGYTAKDIQAMVEPALLIADDLKEMEE